MPSIKDLRIRIRSLQNTNKITAAMKLVATSKLRRAQESITASRPYAEKLSEILNRVASAGDSEHPLLEKREEKVIRLYVYSSDKGLCGGFNNSINKAANRFANEKNAKVQICTLGRKAFEGLKKLPNINIHENYQGITKNPEFEEIAKVANDAIKDFQNGEIDGVYLAYNVFESVLVQTPEIQQVLPVGSISEQDAKPIDYIFEPGQQELLEQLLPDFVRNSFYRGLLENAAGEHGARMTAMDNATNNSSEMIDKLTLISNRLRQAAITTELTEIVSGAESLKG